MEFIYYIIDNNSGPTTTTIEEPIGFDDVDIVLKRDKNSHGVFFDYNAFESGLQYFNEAAKILKNAYDVYGTEANCELLVEVICNNVTEVLYHGKFDFNSFNPICSEFCHVKIRVEQLGCTMKLLNRADQKVDLSTLKDFNNTTLPAYTGLGQTIELPSKSILIQSLAKVQNLINTDLFNTPCYVQANFATYQWGCMIPFDDIVYTEVSNTQFQTIGDWFHIGGIQGNGCLSLPAITPLLNVQPIGELGCLGTQYDVDIKVNGTFKITANSGVDVDVRFFVKAGSGSHLLAPILLNDLLVSQTSVTGANSFTFNTGFSGTINLLPNENIFIFMFVSMIDWQNHPSQVEFDFDAGNSCLIKTLSSCEPTPCKTFLINEAFSRVVEATTDSCMKVYSEYFGRTDSEPFQSQIGVDGCGSLEALTNGYFIRGVELIKPDTPPQMLVSFKDLIDSQNAIHNIGYGIEDNTIEGGEWVRIEPMEYFYNNNVIHTCENVAEISKKVNKDLIYSEFKFGYEKWEAEEYNGIDEFLTSRTYRTTLTSIKNSFDKVCKFITSGFAIEVTRRKGHANSKDWRYDKDNFIIQLKRDQSNDLEVEQGGFTNDANIIDPATILNFKLRPAHILLRWFKSIMQSYRNYSTNKLAFNDGTGNYYAEGLMPNGCIMSSQVIAENQEFNTGLFDNAIDGKPLFVAEYDEYEFYLSYKDWKNIKANPRGLIAYQCKDEPMKYGWIDTLKYNINSGNATFTLIPKLS